MKTRKQKRNVIPEMSASIRSGALLLRLPLQEPKLSKSGKTAIVASTHGFKPVGVRVLGGREVYVTANACVYPEPGEGTD